MKIQPLDGWDAPGNHDSFRAPRDVAALIRQLARLPGLATQDYTGVPSMIKLFSEKCIHGDRPIFVVKGIHQRWGKNPQPHIRIRFYYTVGPSGKLTPIDMHVQLSEELSHWDPENYSWKTVALSYVEGENSVQSWPAQFTQEVSNIQSQQGRRRGLRRMSVGCYPPPAPVAPLAEATAT